jgi:GTPase SAR1 family protein
MLKTWINDLESYGPANVIVFVVANKSDLMDHQITITEGQSFANSHHALFKVTSAKENKGITELLDSIIVQYEKKNPGFRTNNNKKIAK